MVISDRIPVVPRNRNSRNSVPNPSAEEKTVRNSVPLNKNTSKISELPSEPFSGRENNSEFRSVVPNSQKLSKFFSELFSGRKNNSEFRSVEQKEKQTLGIPFRTIPRKRKIIRVECGGHQSDRRSCASSVKLHFFAEFHSFPFRSELRNWLFRGIRNASE